MTDTEVAGLLDQIRTASDGSVVRTWFFQSLGGPGNWAGFDRVVALARAHGVRLIPTLVNQWGDCEPSVGKPAVRNYKTLSWYQSGYRQGGDGYPLSYRDYAVAVAARYAGDPTIAFWQLVNEAEDKTAENGACAPDAASVMRSFADDVVAAIHRVDGNHLISLGTIGSGQCGTSGSAAFRQVNGGSIDLCEVHDYGDPTHAVPGDPWNGIQARIDDCHALGKPIFVGEAGICADVQVNGSCSGTMTSASLQRRAAFFEAKMTAQFGAGVVGYLIWSKGQTGSGGYDVGTSDPTESAMLRVTRIVS
jgi:mannan endo-1,4-beta-mannosidase